MVVLLHVSPSPGPASLSLSRSLQILFTRKMLDATRKAIGMPEAVIDGYSFETTGRVGDTSVHVSRRNVGWYGSLSAC